MDHSLDILDPDLYVAGVPHDRFARLRREAPVFWHEEPEGRGFWAVTRYEDVVSVARDAATFSSERGGTQIPDLPPEDPRASPDVLVNMDPPRHSRYRALISKAFTPHGVEQLEGFVREVVQEAIAGVAQRGECDFVSDLAAHVPSSVILKMVGVPEDDRARIAGWVRRILTPDDPEFASSPEDVAGITRSFMEYAHELAARRRQDPKDDLLSRLMAAEVDGTSLTYQEFGLFFLLLLAAGTDTTRHLLANGTLTLAAHPEQRDVLGRDPSLMPAAVEEMLRYCPPMLHVRRTATRDVELRGQRIAEGDKVVIWMVSANRDEEVFENPDRFDMKRSPNDHVSFLTGSHFCVGNSLARMQATTAFRELLRRLPDLEIDGDVERIRSNWLNGLKRMPVRFSSRSR